MSEHNPNAPELTSERSLQEWLKEIIENASWDNGLHETEVLSFEETESESLPTIKGLSLHLPDGSQFRLTIAKER